MLSDSVVIKFGFHYFLFWKIARNKSIAKHLSSLLGDLTSYKTNIYILKRTGPQLFESFLFKRVPIFFFIFPIMLLLLLQQSNSGSCSLGHGTSLIKKYASSDYKHLDDKAEALFLRNCSVELNELHANLLSATCPELLEIPPRSPERLKETNIRKNSITSDCSTNHSTFDDHLCVSSTLSVFSDEHGQEEEREHISAQANCDRETYTDLEKCSEEHLDDSILEEIIYSQIVPVDQRVSFVHCINEENRSDVSMIEIPYVH